MNNLPGTPTKRRRLAAANSLLQEQQQTANVDSPTVQSSRARKSINFPNQPLAHHANHFLARQKLSTITNNPPIVEQQQEDEEARTERKNDLKVFEETLRTKLIESIRVGQRYELLLIGIIVLILCSTCLWLFSSFSYSRHVFLFSIATVAFFMLSGGYAKIQKPKVLLNQMNRVLRVFHVRFNITKLKLVRLKTKQSTQPTPHSAEEIATSFGSGLPGVLDGVGGRN